MVLQFYPLAALMKVAVLCNSRLGLPAIQQLISMGKVTACATPDRVHEEKEEIAWVCQQTGTPHRTFSKIQVKEEMELWLQTYIPDVVLVLTFPHRIPEKLLNKPKYGFINFHFGLLPAYRGADAIFWQLKNRETTGAISIHQMSAELDKGPLYAIQQVPIQANDTYGSHSNALAFSCAGAAINTLSMLQQNTTPVIQNEHEAKYYKRPALDDVTIDWTENADNIIALINACNPWNKGALCTIDGYPLKIIRATKGNLSQSGEAGEIIQLTTEKGFEVACGKNESILIHMCYFNNEFVTLDKLTQSGLRTGLRFDDRRKNIPLN